MGHVPRKFTGTLNIGLKAREVGRSGGEGAGRGRGTWPVKVAGSLD